MKPLSLTSNNELEHERAVGNNEQIHGSKSLASCESQKIQGNIFQVLAYTYIAVKFHLRSSINV